MILKEALSKPFAKYIVNRIRQSVQYPDKTQVNIFKTLVDKGKNTVFGNDHRFDKIKKYDQFKEFVPIRDYEGFVPYISRIKNGEKNILWPGKPIYFTKTSGTTSGTKYIPVTNDSMPNHINSARNALLMYIVYTGNTGFINGKMIFLSGSPKLELHNGILTGRLSGIVNHHIPGYLKKNQLPSYQTNIIEDWEEKIDMIVNETLQENMTLISGIPPWVQMYFEKLLIKTGKSIKEIFPDFSLFVHGGVNFEPYKTSLEKLIGGKVDYLETYPASEGFIAFQDQIDKTGLLLNVDSGIFFEFIKADEYFTGHPTRIQLKDVELNVNYALVLTTNAGLWAYDIGDTVKFVSENPYRIVVTGRIKQYLSAMGEHVITEEVESALLHALENERAQIIEFTVAPQLNVHNEIPFHEWFIEFDVIPENLNNFAIKIDSYLQNKNSYYKDLRTGKMLQSLKIRPLKKNSFRDYMKSKGKLGGQNKVPRLSNDRTIASELTPFILNTQLI